MPLGISDRNNLTSRKRQTENEKRFFSSSTRRLTESVEGLNSSLAAVDFSPILTHQEQTHAGKLGMSMN